MPDTDDLHRAYALQSPDDSRKLYGDWAETYDTGFVEARGYVLHDHVARAFADAGGQGPVLDLGAGTGLCGAALRQYGVDSIDGTDISPEMLQQAETKQAYRSLFEGDILAGLTAPDGSYHGIVSAGTFTCGHVGPDGLDEVARLLRPGGLAVIAVRDVHYVDAGFKAKLDALSPQLELIRKNSVQIYTDAADTPNADDIAFLLQLVRLG